MLYFPPWDILNTNCPPTPPPFTPAFNCCRLFISVHPGCSLTIESELHAQQSAPTLSTPVTFKMLFCGLSFSNKREIVFDLYHLSTHFLHVSLNCGFFCLSYLLIYFRCCFCIFTAEQCFAHFHILDAQLKTILQSEKIQLNCLIKAQLFFESYCLIYSFFVWRCHMRLQYF